MMRCRTITSLLLLFSVAASADQVASIKRQVSVETMTDSAAGNYTIELMEMSGDGRFLVVAARQTVADSRGCFPLNLRLVDTQLGTDTQVVDGQSFNTGVGNNCRDTLTANFHLDHDGSTLVFESFEITGDPDAPTQNGTRIERYERVGDARSTVIRTVPHTISGSTNPARIQLLAFSRVRVSGDGSTVFWINFFGPEGSGQPAPSGNTIYLADIATGTPTPVLSQAEFDQVPSLTAVGGGFCCPTRSLLQPGFDGSLLAFATTLGFNFRDLVAMDPTAGAAQADVVLSISDNINFYGPNADLNATVAAYAVDGFPDPADDGLYIVDLATGATPTKLRDRETFRAPSYPFLSTDGSTVAYLLDGKVFAARTDGSDFFAVSQPMTYFALSLGISADGGSIAYIATFRPDGLLGPAPATGDVMLFRQSVPNGFPTLEGVVGTPSVLMSKEPGFTPPITHTFFLDVAGTSDNLLTSAHGPQGYNPGGSGGGIGGEHESGTGIPDDGSFEGDAAAGDGIYTDGFLAAFAGYEESDSVFFLRASMPIVSQRIVTYADIEVPLLGVPTDVHQEFFFDDTSIVMGTTGVTLTLTQRPGNGSVKAERFDHMPPNRTTALTPVYRIIALNFPNGRYSGSFSFAYSDSAVQAADLDEGQLAVFVSDSGGDSWTEVPSIVDSNANTVTGILSNQRIPLLWAIDSGVLGIPVPTGLSPGARFGAAIAVDDNLVAVGAPEEEGGVVYVYRLDGDGLIEEARIDIPDTFSADQFGAALALEGGRLVIGAPGNSPVPKGSALQAAILERLAGSWSTKQTLAGDQGGGDGFGSSIALVGGQLMIGAPEDVGSGAAYSYNFDGDQFIFGQKIKPSGLAGGSRFGATVAGGGARFAIGAPGAPVGNAVAGTVSIYERIAGNLQATGEITGSNPQSGDEFGTSISLDGTELAVGAPGESGEEGAVYLYDIGGNAIERLRATAGTPSGGARFGQSVAVSDGMLAAGAPFEASGAIYRFESDSGAMVDRLGATGTQEAFGAALAMRGDRLGIGAPTTDANLGAAVLKRDPDTLFGSSFE